MSQLNSLVLDGTVVTDAEKVGESHGISVWNFRISTKQGDVTSYFDISLSTNERERWVNGIRIGRSIRIVGRLVQNDKSVKIIAEHIELKLRIESVQEE